MAGREAGPGQSPGAERAVRGVGHQVKSLEHSGWGCGGPRRGEVKRPGLILRPWGVCLWTLVGWGVGGGFEPCSLGTPRPSSAPTPYSPSPPVQNGVRYFTHSVETEQPVDGWGFLSPMHLSRSFATGWWPS